MIYSMKEEVIISSFHLFFIYIACFWTLIYIIMFIDPPQWLLTEDSFISVFNAGSGTAVNASSGGLKNPLLTTSGKLQILGFSFLFAFLTAIILYYILKF